MAVGPPLAYVDQYISIVRRQSSAGFNTDAICVLLVANITRVIFWFASSVVPVTTHDCVPARVAISGGLFLALHWSSIYVTALGFMALGLEATLPIPQLLLNWKRRSTAGFRLSILLAWLLGDTWKLLYFLLTPGDNPLAFKACAAFQLSIDLCLCTQTWLYRSQTARDEAAESTRCFLEELPKDTIVVGHYKAEEWAEESKSFVINDHLGIQIVVTEVESGDKVVNTRGLPQGKFTFTSHEAGDHTICLKTNYTGGWFSTPQVRMHLDIAVGEAKVDEEGEREHVKDLAGKVKDLNSRLADIRREQQFQREREAEFRALSEKTNSRAVWWSIAQLLTLVVACAVT
ncbi:emp24p/erv25p- protein [Microbotryomycetes sp. JL221]|nr:emp24p/erv25p- protein [Microbotryomycetes sp. JL221]